MITNLEFRQHLKNLISNYDSRTKEEYYAAFIEMTDRFLNEMATTLAIQKTLTSEFGEARAEMLLRKAAENSVFMEPDGTDPVADNQEKVIYELLDYLNSEAKT